MKVMDHFSVACLSKVAFIINKKSYAVEDIIFNVRLTRLIM
jgi:hypothetical protein